MSQTFSLVCADKNVCADKKLKIWVGQGRQGMEVFYSGEPDVMDRLGRFLEAARGHALMLICDDEDTCDAENFVEFEDDEEQPRLKNRHPEGFFVKEKTENQSYAITSKQFDRLIESIRRIGEGSPSSNPTGFELLSIAVAGEGIHDSVAAALRDIAESLKEIADAIRDSK